LAHSQDGQGGQLRDHQPPTNIRQGRFSELNSIFA
jgi:hypothetical protein